MNVRSQEMLDQIHRYQKEALKRKTAKVSNELGRKFKKQITLNGSAAGSINNLNPGSATFLTQNNSMEDLTASKSILRNKNDFSPVKSPKNGSGSMTQDKTTETPRTQKDEDTAEMHESTILRKRMNRPARDEQSLQNLFEST